MPAAAGVLYPFLGIPISHFAAAAMSLSSVSVIANRLCACGVDIRFRINDMSTHTRQGCRLRHDGRPGQPPDRPSRPAFCVCSAQCHDRFVTNPTSTLDAPASWPQQGLKVLKRRQFVLDKSLDETKVLGFGTPALAP